MEYQSPSQWKRDVEGLWLLLLSDSWGSWEAMVRLSGRPSEQSRRQLKEAANGFGWSGMTYAGPQVLRLDPNYLLIQMIILDMTENHLLKKSTFCDCTKGHRKTSRMNMILRSLWSSSHVDRLNINAKFGLKTPPGGKIITLGKSRKIQFWSEEDFSG